MKSQQVRKKTLGEKIKLIRKERNLSLRKLAAAADMEHSHVNLIEKGETSPSIVVFEELSEALNVSPGVFFDPFNRSLDPIDMYVTEQVKLKRIENKITIQELAEAISESQTFVEDVENGRGYARYSVANLNKLAICFRCSPKDFMPTAHLEIKN